MTRMDDFQVLDPKHARRDRVHILLRSSRAAPSAATVLNGLLSVTQELHTRTPRVNTELRRVFTVPRSGIVFIAVDGISCSRCSNGICPYDGLPESHRISQDTTYEVDESIRRLRKTMLLKH